MKTTGTGPRAGAGEGQRGNALIIGITLVIIMLGLSTAYIHISVGESLHARVAGQRTQAFYAAEAGVNRAIVDLGAGGKGVLGTSAKPVTFGGGAFWTVVEDSGGGSLTLTSTGRVGEQEESVEVVTVSRQSNVFTKALFGDLTVFGTGNLLTDSYDSEKGTYASQATNTHKITGVTYADVDGGLGSNGDIDLAGNATILGDVTPGPKGSVSISGGGVYVDGSTAPAPSKSDLPEVEYTPTVASSGLLKKGQTLGTGTYRYDEIKLAAKSVLEVTGDAVVYVDGKITLTGQALIVVRPGASLVIYQDEADCQFTGQGVVNETVVPESLQIHTKGADVKFTGNAFLIGVLYAPEAHIMLTGNADIFGSFVAKTVKSTGNGNFHYDVALARNDSEDSESEVQVVSWRRVSSSGE